MFNVLRQHFNLSIRVTTIKFYDNFFRWFFSERGEKKWNNKNSLDVVFQPFQLNSGDKNTVGIKIWKKDF